MFDIITVGSNTVDLFVKTDTPLIHMRKKGKRPAKSMIAYPLGEKILITHLEHKIGGGGTNTAVAFSRLGLKTAYLGKIGHDDNGLKVFRCLKKENVAFIGALGKETGMSVILDSVEDDRTILTYKGCNNKLSFNEIDKAKLRTEWFYFSSMMESSFNTLVKLSEYAIKSRIKVALNPSSYLVNMGIRKISKVMNNCDLLILNKEEARVLSGKKEIRQVLKVLAQHVNSAVIVTDGKNGAYCYDGEFIYGAKPRKNIKIVETTGAGDAFGAGFTAGQVMGKSLKESFLMGFIQAEAVIQEYGSKNNLLSRKKLLSLVKKDARKVTIVKLKR